MPKRLGRTSIVLACLIVACLGGRADAPVAIEPLFLAIAETTSPLQQQPLREPIKRSRPVAINPRVLQHLSTKNPSTAPLCQLNLFPGTDLLAQLAPQLAGVDGQSFAGSVEGEQGSQVVLVEKGGLIAGSVLLPSRACYVIQPAGPLRCEIDELDFEQLLPCGTVSSDTLGLHVPPLMRVKTGSRLALAVSNSTAAVVQEHEIELMIVYTPKAAQGVFGADSMEALIDPAVAEANNVYQNSGTGVRFRLVHTAQVAYEETGDLSMDLDRLRSTNDGFLEEVHAWRDTYQADLIYLVVNASAGFAGVAAFPAGPESGFSVLKCSQLAGYGMLAHELGHNFGCDHDRENARGSAYFSYSYGHRLESEGEIYRTIASPA